MTLPSAPYRERQLRRIPPSPWRWFRRARTFRVLGWALWIPYGAAVLFVARRLGIDVLALPLCLGWMALWAASGVYVVRFKCPRCALPFVRKGVWPAACFHCGVSVGAPPAVPDPPR